MKDLGVMKQTGTRSQPHIRTMGTAWGGRRLGTAICQAQGDKDLSAGGWEVGWRMSCIARKIYLASPPNYKPPKRNDLTITPIQDVVVVVVGGVSLSFLWNTWAISCGGIISNATFLALASLWSLLSASLGVTRPGMAFLNTKCWVRLWVFNLVFYRSWVQNQVLHRITK